MYQSIKLIDSSAIMPVSVADVKLHCHISHAVQDASIEAYIAAGTAHAEMYLRQSLISKVWRISYDNIPSGVIELPYGPLQEVEIVVCYDDDGDDHAVDLSDLIIDTEGVVGRIALKKDKVWPDIVQREIGAFAVEYLAGYGDIATAVPQNIRHAIRLFAAYADDNRAAEEAEVPDVFYTLLVPGRTF